MARPSNQLLTLFYVDPGSEAIDQGLGGEAIEPALTLFMLTRVAQPSTGGWVARPSNQLLTLFYVNSAGTRERVSQPEGSGRVTGGRGRGILAGLLHLVRQHLGGGALPARAAHGRVGRRVHASAEHFVLDERHSPRPVAAARGMQAPSPCSAGDGDDVVVHPRSRDLLNAGAGQRPRGLDRWYQRKVHISERPSGLRRERTVRGSSGRAPGRLEAEEAEAGHGLVGGALLSTVAQTANAAPSGLLRI